MTRPTRRSLLAVCALSTDGVLSAPCLLVGRVQPSPTSVHKSDRANSGSLACSSLTYSLHSLVFSYSCSSPRQLLTKRPTDEARHGELLTAIGRREAGRRRATMRGNTNQRLIIKTNHGDRPNTGDAIVHRKRRLMEELPRYSIPPPSGTNRHPCRAHLVGSICSSTARQPSRNCRSRDSLEYHHRRSIIYGASGRTTLALSCTRKDICRHCQYALEMTSYWRGRAPYYTASLSTLCLGFGINTSDSGLSYYSDVNTSCACRRWCMLCFEDVYMHLSNATRTRSGVKLCVKPVNSNISSSLTIYIYIYIFIFIYIYSSLREC